MREKPEWMDRGGCESCRNKKELAYFGCASTLVEGGAQRRDPRDDFLFSAVNSSLPAFAFTEFIQGGFLGGQDNNAFGLCALLEAAGRCGGAVVIDGSTAHSQGTFAAFAVRRSAIQVTRGQSGSLGVSWPFNV